MVKKLLGIFILMAGMFVPLDNLARGGGGHGGGFHGGGGHGGGFHGGGYGAHGARPAGHGGHAQAHHPAHRGGHGHYGQHGCRTCAFGGWWGGAPLWWDFGFAALWYPWLLTPAITAQASDDPTIVVLPEETQAQQHYDYTFVTHQDNAGRIRTEQILMPDGNSVIYVHDKDNAKRIIEKHTVDLQGKHRVEKSDNGSIKRMRIKGKTKIVRYTVDDAGNILDTQISYAKQI